MTTTNGTASLTDAERLEAAQAAKAYLDMDLLRFTTAGSVDDGKSTLIGRLLYDSKAIFEDQMDAIAEASQRRGDDDVDLALLTDGLRAEREQGITIDVAYRYFATPKRKFIIADTPGHVQYTRNMVTGASTADLAIVLVDARKGVLEQSKRHGFIASLLQIPHLVVAVNKMDLVDYSEERFEEIVRDYTEFSSKLDIHDLTFIPVSALKGDNVVDKSEKTPWYDGPTLLYHLEHVNVSADRNLVDFRFPVQYVVRPNQDFRGFAGTVAAGTVRVGDKIVALPSGKASTVKALVQMNADLEEAEAGDAIVVTLDDEIDISRGDMIVRERNLPEVADKVEAMLCWMSEEPIDRSRQYKMLHTTRMLNAFVDEIAYRVDVDTLHREETDTLGLNDIGRVRITTAQPLFFDPYNRIQETGAFILIDPFSNRTVAAGMIRSASRDADQVAGQGANLASAAARRARSENVVWEEGGLSQTQRETINGHRAAVVWLTGLSGSGKTTIAREVERQLVQRGIQTAVLDGDRVRHGLSGDLGFSDEDRAENNRRVGEVAKLFFEQGIVTLCTFVSPFRKDRAFVRSLIPDGRFFEAFADVDIETAKARDPKGLYAKVKRGEIKGFTGIDAPYEKPEDAELVLDTQELSVQEAATQVVARLEAEGIIPASE